MSEYDQNFSPGELRSLDTAARVAACLSLVGSSFTIVSFISYRPLRKPVNRLAFSIAVANIFSCLAYSWARQPIAAGRDSAWCQTQGFLITWFVMTDPLLVMVMAINVLLTVRTKRTSDELRKIDDVGIGLAFVAPLIPAIVYLIWRPGGRTVYGDATLWCWIAKESDLLRLVAFYIPIWVIISVSILLFVLSGKQILDVRRRVKHTESRWLAQPHLDPGREADARPRTRRLSSMSKGLGRGFFTRTTRATSAMSADGPLDSSSTTEAHLVEYKGGELLAPISSRDVPDSPALTPIATSTTLDRAISAQSGGRRSSSRFDQMHWRYAKFAILCTAVLFITWVPISVNRVYNNFVSPNHQIYSLYVVSAACIPLHGFGNCVIYVTTSWTECRDFVTCASRGATASPDAHLRRSSSAHPPRSRGLRKRVRDYAQTSVAFARRHWMIRRPAAESAC